jgi:hypothetical protein
MYKVCYRNGYYDYERQGFYEYTNTVKTLIRINKDYRELNSEILERMDVVYKILLYPMFSVKVDETGQTIKDENYKKMREMLKYLSRRIAGRKEDKVCCSLHGARSSGRSTLIDLLCNTYEEYIVIDWMTLFLTGATRTQQEEEREYLSRHKFNRIIICRDDERQYNPQVKLDGNLIKKVCSGINFNETVLNGETRNIKLQASMILCPSSSTICEVEPAEAMSHIINIRTSAIFTPKREISEKRVRYRAEGYSIVEENQEIRSSFIKEEKNQEAFMHILLAAYRAK